MKKKLLALFIVALMLLSALPAQAIVWRDPSIWVTVDGRPLYFDVDPQIIEGRTMVPMRLIFESMGMTVEWDGDTQTVKAVGNGRIVETTIGKKNITVVTENGPHVEEADIAPQIVDNRTLVPVRFVAQALECTVLWVAVSRTVIIWTPEPAEEVTTMYYDEARTKVCYQGEVANDMPNGRGTYYYEDGSVLAIGTFRDGQLYGEGAIYNHGGAGWQEGMFIDNRLEGNSVVTYEDGAMIEAPFKNGLAHGDGTYYLADGSYFVGTFREGQFYSGTLYRVNGEIEVLAPPTE